MRQVIEAGLNVRTTFTPPNAFIDPLRELVKEGCLSMKTLDQGVADVLRVKFRLVLLKNDSSLLPLDKRRYKRILVTGPLVVTPEQQRPQGDIGVSVDITNTGSRKGDDTVSFTLHPDDLALPDKNMVWTVEPGKFQVMIGSSSTDIRVKKEFVIR